MKSLKFTILSLFAFFLLPGSLLAQDTTQYIIPNRNNSAIQQDKPYVIMISIDGLRYDLADKYDAKFLKKKRSEGVEAASMKPSFPSMTFPNHYALATGLYPSHHGIVANTFYAGKNADQYYALYLKEAVTNPGFYAGIPLWVLAERQKMVSANFYWVGSEAPIDSIFSTYYYHYNEDIPVDRRIEIVKDWLQLPAEKRPHLIMFYMPEVDHALHANGINSDKVRDAVQLIDHTIEKMNAMTDALGLPVNYILVSDHGMMDVDTEHPLSIPELVDTSKFKMATGATLNMLYAKGKDAIKPVYKALKAQENGYSVYLKKNVPSRYHYGKKDDFYNRIGDIVIVSDPGKAFSFNGKTPNKGNHGYDNSIPEMQATFYAWGPAFKSGLKIPSFENVNVYPLVAKVLGLNLMCKIDGDIKVLEGVLR